MAAGDSGHPASIPAARLPTRSATGSGQFPNPRAVVGQFSSPAGASTGLRIHAGMDHRTSHRLPLLDLAAASPVQRQFSAQAPTRSGRPISPSTALRSPVETIVHSRQGDRGSQFRSRKFVHALLHNGLHGWMGRVGACGDNAAMESFSPLLQRNVLDRRRWTTRAELRLGTVGRTAPAHQVDAPAGHMDRPGRIPGGSARSSRRTRDAPGPADPLREHRGRHRRELAQQQRPHRQLDLRPRRRRRRHAFIAWWRLGVDRFGHGVARQRQPPRDRSRRQLLRRIRPANLRPILHSDHSPIRRVLTFDRPRHEARQPGQQTTSEPDLAGLRLACTDGMGFRFVEQHQARAEQSINNLETAEATVIPVHRGFRILSVDGLDHLKTSVVAPIVGEVGPSKIRMCGNDTGRMVNRDKTCSAAGVNGAEHYFKSCAGTGYLCHPHHRNGTHSSKSQWALSRPDECHTFCQAEWLRAADDRGLWFVAPNLDTVFGTRNERKAFFASSDNDSVPWHGYPVGPGTAHHPPKDVVAEWHRQGRITYSLRVKIMRGTA